MLLHIPLEESPCPPVLQPTFVDHARDGLRLCIEPMSNGDYREKEGGARLEEVWHVSKEGCAEWERVMNAIGLRST